MVAVQYVKYEFGNKMHYSVQPRHLHYTDVMLSLCHVWFSPGLGLGFEHLSLGLGLGLGLLGLESKPAINNSRPKHVQTCDRGLRIGPIIYGLSVVASLQVKWSEVKWSEDTRPLHMSKYATALGLRPPEQMPACSMSPQARDAPWLYADRWWFHAPLQQGFRVQGCCRGLVLL